MKKILWAVCAAILFGTTFFASITAEAGIVGGPNAMASHGGMASKLMPEVDGSGLVSPAVGSSGPQIQTLDPTLAAKYGLTTNPSEIGAFRTVCDVSHMAFDDPIVAPGRPGASHLHTFFGNTGVTSATTSQTLLSTGNSTCHGGTLNRSSYWVPAVIDTATGVPVKPRTAIIYYKQGYNIADSSIFVQVPQGLKVIAGSAMNSIDVRATNPWAESAYTWRCMSLTTGAPVIDSQQIPNCAVGTELWMLVTFPQCWDGVNLDSPDHKSHMAYPSGGRCPATHPKVIPEISYQIVYPYGAVTAKWRLASDMYDESLPGGRSAHGDYMMGWQQDIIQAWQRNCINGRRDCHADLLGDYRILQ